MLLGRRLRVPAYVENVFELLGSAGGQPGQFYLDAAAATIYYVPHVRAGSLLDQALVHSSGPRI